MDQVRPDVPLTGQPTPAEGPSPKLDRKTRMLRRRRSVFSEYGYLLIAAGIPTLIVLLIYIARGLYPLDDGCVLVLDLNGQYSAFYHALRDVIKGDGSLFYSFSRNLGGEFLGIFDYYVASPFAWLIALFPETRMLEALLVLFLLKTALLGFNMGFYLHKHSVERPNRLSIICFSTLYAVCSYAIVQQHNSMWIDAMLWLPLLTYGLEELIKKGHFRLFTFTLAITLFSNFYIGYMVCIYVIGYSFYYYFAHNRNNENNPMGEKNHFGKSVGRVALWSILAVCMAALAILSAKYSLGFGKNEFSNPDWSVTQKFNLFLLPFKMLPSSYDTVRPAGLPFIYCGTLTLLMVPAFFLCKKFSDREKVAAGCFILFFVLSFTISDLDLIWHGFQKPNWLNYRYSFMLCFFLLVLAFRAFEQIRFLPRKSLALVTAVWAIYIMVVQQLGGFLTESNEYLKVRPWATVGLGLGCLFVYFVLICVAGRTVRAKNTICTIMAFVVVIEVFLSGLSEMNALDKDVTFSKYSRYNDFLDTFLPISDTIRDNDAGFYRTEKTYHRKTNDNFSLNFKGLSCSTSTLNQDVIDLLDTMGYVSKSHWSKYCGGNPVADSIMGIKYLVTDNDMTEFYGDPIYENEMFEYEEGFTPVNKPDVYLNSHALSLAFGVADDYEDFRVFTTNKDGKRVDVYKTPMELFNDMITAMLGETETVEVFKKATQTVSLADAECTNCEYKTNYTDLVAWQSTDVNKTASITLTYEVPTGTELYLYLPASGYNREVGVSVNGKSKGGFDGGSESTYRRVASLGTMSDSALTLTLELKQEVSGKKMLYVPKADSNGDPYDSFIYYIDKAVWADAMTRLQSMSYQIDDNCADDHLTGTITTRQDDQLIATTISYDEGWNVYVDGERVEIFPTSDVLVGFRIDDAGEHTLEMRYMPKTVAFGLILSILATLFFLILVFAHRWLVKLPLLSPVLQIPGEPLPTIETAEDRAAIAPGDIGDDPPDVQPVPADAPDDIDEDKPKRPKRK